MWRFFVFALVDRLHARFFLSTRADFPILWHVSPSPVIFLTPKAAYVPGERKGGSKIPLPLLVGFCRPWSTMGFDYPFPNNNPAHLTKHKRGVVSWFFETSAWKISRKKKDTLHQVNFHNYRKLPFISYASETVILFQRCLKERIKCCLIENSK